MAGRPLSQRHRDWAARTAARRIAAAIVSGMAETDVSFDVAARRLDIEAGELRDQLLSLIEGKAEEHLCDIADLAFAFGLVLQPTVQAVKMVNDPPEDVEG